MPDKIRPAVYTLEVNYFLEDLENIVATVLDKTTSKVILFYGDMGVGKTTLIKAFLKHLGSEVSGHSPTFSIVNEYEIKDDLIYHFDLYRIEDEEEALNFGIEDYLYSEHWVFIEWPEKLGNLLPESHDSIYIGLNPNNSRTLKLSTSNDLTPKTAKTF